MLIVDNQNQCWKVLGYDYPKKNQCYLKLTHVPINVKDINVYRAVRDFASDDFKQLILEQVEHEK